MLGGVAISVSGFKPSLSKINQGQFTICGPSTGLWKNSNTSECIRFNIIPENQDDPVIDQQDASRQDVVNELVDLWGELRAIRNHFTLNSSAYDDVEDDDLYIIQKPPSPLDKFWQKVSEAKTMIEEDQEEWDFMIKDFVDAAVFAYYDLSQADRLAIVH